MSKHSQLCTMIVIAALLFSHPLAFAANGSVVYTYDALGRVLTASYDTGVIVIYTYDPNGNRTQQVVNVNSSGAVWENFNWDAALWQ
jgi:YD repeat-containing protein